MWLYLHHTASDIIDLNPATGHWRPVDDSEKPAGALVLADLPIRGGYTIEGDKRYFNYWTADKKFVFRTDHDLEFEICQKRSDDSIVMLAPTLDCTIVPSRYSDGRLRQGFSQVRLLDAAGDAVFELDYDAERYLRLYQSDLTAAAAVQDLADWDFFVALKGAFEIFKERAATGRIAFSIDDDGTVQIQGRRMPHDELIYADTGQKCPKSGVQASLMDLRVSAAVAHGESMPASNGDPVQWVWSRAE